MSVTLQLKSRGRPLKKLPQTIDVNQKSDKSELVQKISSATGLSIHRIRLTKAADNSVVENLNLPDQSVIYVKDLGPQIAWRTVFFVEYIGPLLIHPLFFIPAVRKYIYPHIPATLSTIPPTSQQTFVLYLILLHYFKREYETLFVHKFSSATMPAFNIFKNSFHYWILSGALLGWFTYHPLNALEGKFSVFTPSNTVILVATLVWVWAQLSNFSAHLTLSNLRPAGTTVRGIPKGYGFDWVTCPNYFFEAVGWICVWVLSGCNWAVLLFAAVSTAQMYAWAIKKEKRYRKEFGDKYKRKRAVIVPGLL
ncbi:3-oxo-5-alpha-steroid 4-dehydrogenase-domain-containing protein [Peziza echinospora]|nr:3-oxo-5-alpha-steroid 4-dehydrogenase-domain-containing protein [Peziza echinospora]